MPSGACTVTSHLRRSYSAEDFCGIAQAILGTTYNLSIVLIGSRRARALNVAHRNKSYAANVLSFPLDNMSGELFLNVGRAHAEAARFGLSPDGHVRYLLIHGCLHLKGYTHGGTMERAERAFLKKFNIR